MNEYVVVSPPRAQCFYFDGFSIESAKGQIVYTYSTDVGHSFVHVLEFEFPEHVESDGFRAAAFALGMAELVHFWKALLTPMILVRAGQLEPEQIMFWENLYTQGLGEFFYVNQIDFRGLIHIESADDAPHIPARIRETQTGRIALVPFGGGKDSLVTGELLKAQGKDFSWFELETLSFGEKLREVSGNESCVRVGRNVEKNFAPIIELVAQGAPNGHVPITATYMMSAVLVAQINGFSDIVFSLERSASEGNLEYLGYTINHQYSKSLEFEAQARAYIAEYIDPELQLFSLLRPLYELQIVERFSTYPQYFPYFVSCNRGLKTATWCGECAKCAFMFSALSAFLPPETVIGIFKKNLFGDVSLIPLYLELIGKEADKPFDCVGTLAENLLALYLAGEQYRTRGMPLPIVLAALPLTEGAAHIGMLKEYGTENFIPEGYSIA